MKSFVLYYMKLLAPLLISLLISSGVLCQSADTLRRDFLSKGDRGILYLNTGEAIPAYIEYSTYTNALHATAEAALPKTLTATTIKKLEYFDEHLKRQRTFISHDFSLKTHGIDSSAQFFEVLGVCDGFMLLERTCPLEVSQYTGPVKRISIYGRFSLSKYKDPGLHFRTAMLYTSQLDVICFLVNDEIKPYIVYKHEGTDDLAGTTIEGNRSRTTTTILDKDLPKSLLGSHFKAAQKYARVHNLNWKNKFELALILEHYSSLK